MLCFQFCSFNGLKSTASVSKMGKVQKLQTTSNNQQTQTVLSVLKALQFGDFLEFRRLLCWRGVCKYTRTFKSATHGKSIGEIPVNLFVAITAKKFQCLCYLNVSDYAPFPSSTHEAQSFICNQYTFEKLRILRSVIFPQKLPDSCKHLEIQSVHPQSVKKIEQLCSMNPKLQVLSLFGLWKEDTDVFQFPFIQTLYMNDCRCCLGSFPKLEEIHITGYFYAPFHFSELRKNMYPNVKAIHVELSPDNDIHFWPTFDPEVQIYISLRQAHGEFCAIFGFRVIRVTKPTLSNVWFRWESLDESLDESVWSRFCKFDDVPRDVLSKRMIKKSE